jgi:DNA replication protein DnaC
MKFAQETPFIVFDDLAIRSVSEPFRADLHSVISYRVSNQLPCVYTSNLPLSELPTIYGEQRLYDRIRDLTIQLSFIGESKRGKR